MAMAIQIQSYTKRPKRSFQQDGLLDIASGSAIFALAVLLYGMMVTSAQIDALVAAGETYSRAWEATMPLSNTILVLVNAWVPLSFWAVTTLKRRFVYPRLGYFEPRIANKQLSKVKALIAALAVTALIGGAGLLRPHLAGVWTADMTMVAVGVGISAGLVVNYLKYGFARHLFVAGVSVAASLLLASAHLDWKVAFLRFTLLLGSSCIVSGIFPLIQVLRIPVLTEQDEQ